MLDEQRKATHCLTAPVWIGTYHTVWYVPTATRRAMAMYSTYCIPTHRQWWCWWMRTIPDVSTSCPLRVPFVSLSCPFRVPLESHSLRVPFVSPTCPPSDMWSTCTVNDINAHVHPVLPRRGGPRAHRSRPSDSIFLPLINWYGRLATHAGTSAVPFIPCFSQVSDDGAFRPGVLDAPPNRECPRDAGGVSGHWVDSRCTYIRHLDDPATRDDVFCERANHLTKIKFEITRLLHAHE